ncbi:hypothetical protein XENOCAPTIV_001631 [Xenoophorus captivus]|uniref:Fibronectin type-III domain-containing protein n=1 Tax=Xenoophorus captivus TaxID=1517983 RepID=A0ABV0RT89_9TELE
MQAQNEEMMALVMEQYNAMSVSMEEEKKAKLEQLYDKIVSYQENIDSAKTTLETTAREAETDARVHAAFVIVTIAVIASVPQRPTLQPQEHSSASSTSVTVYWKVNPGDIIDCFQVYCVEDPQGAVSEEYRVTVKESYCVLEDLEPDRKYKVWVMAVNYAGCSLPSERLLFSTGQCRYQLLHNRVQSSVFVTETPERVGAFLDHQLSCLSFYNACSGQLLGTFTQRFSQPCHPALALEQPGSLQVCMVPEVPEFTKS